MTGNDEMQAELDRLRAENQALKQDKKTVAVLREVTFKVGEKGGVSVYGLGRFPVTLYKEQWIRLLDKADDIRTFMKDNEAKLKSKDSPE